MLKIKSVLRTYKYTTNAGVPVNLTSVYDQNNKLHNLLWLESDGPDKCVEVRPYSARYNRKAEKEFSTLAEAFKFVYQKGDFFDIPAGSSNEFIFLDGSVMNFEYIDGYTNESGTNYSSELHIYYWENKYE